MRIAIVGAGIMGRMLAWRLAAQHEVSIYDVDLSGQQSAAWAAGGMLSPTAELMQSDRTLYDLATASVALWQHWFSAYQALIGWQQQGSVLMAHRQDQADLVHQVARIQKMLGATGKQAIQKQDDLTYRLLGEACVDVEKVLDFLGQAPVTWQEKQVVDLEALAREVNVCLDCRGYQAQAVFSDLRAVRGELLYVDAPEVVIAQPLRLIHPRYPIYIIPRGEGIYAIGASEIESKDRSPMSVRTCMELLGAAYGVDVGFAEARILDMRVGLRPALPSNHPEIKVQGNVIAVNGLYRHGFLLAPILAKQVEERLHDLD